MKNLSRFDFTAMVYRVMDKLYADERFATTERDIDYWFGVFRAGMMLDLLANKGTDPTSYTPTGSKAKYALSTSYDAIPHVQYDAILHGPIKIECPQPTIEGIKP